MKNYLKLVTSLLVSLLISGTGLKAQSLSIEPFKFKKGETFTINIDMTNEENTIRGIQCYLTLPEGFSFQENEDEEYAVVTEERTGNQHYANNNLHNPQELEIILSTTAKKNYFLKGTEGAVLNVWVKADEDTPFGNYSLLVNKIKLVRDTGLESVVQDGFTTSFTYCSGIDYFLHESGVGTLLLPFNAEVPKGLLVFIATDVVDDVITLEQQAIIEAGVPLIVMGESGEYMFAGIPTFMELQASVGLLTGTTENTTIDAGYVLQTQDNMTGFYRVKEDNPITVPAFRCWLNYNGSAEVIEFKDISDGIRNLDVNKVTTEGYYDLQGRKLEEIRTGIYITNSKKIFIKH